MATNTESEQKDEMKDTLAFLRLYRYISLYCTVCDGEFSIEEAGQQVGNEDWIVQSAEQLDPEVPEFHNLVCPECAHPHLEVLLGV